MTNRDRIETERQFFFYLDELYYEIDYLRRIKFEYAYDKAEKLEPYEEYDYYVALAKSHCRILIDELHKILHTKTIPTEKIDDKKE